MSDTQRPLPASSSLATSSPATSSLYDVVIVGAGPAGSALAIWLATEGWRVLLVEREQLPHHKVCGEFLSPEAQRTFVTLGVEPMITALAPVHLMGAQVTTASGRTLALNLPGQAWGISRYALDAALAAAATARGADVLTETTVTSYQAANAGHFVQLRRWINAASAHDASAQGVSSGIYHVEARALVLACGRHGAPRPGVPTKSRPTHKPARDSCVGIKCHFANVAMPAQVELYLFTGGYIGINPVENGEANICALASYDAFARAGRSPRALIEAAAQWNPAFGERLREAHALPATECAVAPIDSWRTPSPWDRLPCIGDTAAMIPPLCGDGMAMALRSAELCGPLVSGYLRKHYAWGEVGKRHSRLWHHEFNQRLRVGRWLEATLLSASTADIFLQVGAHVPAVANYLLQATRGASHEA